MFKIYSTVDNVYCITHILKKNLNLINLERGGEGTNKPFTYFCIKSKIEELRGHKVVTVISQNLTFCFRAGLKQVQIRVKWFRTVDGLYTG